MYSSAADISGRSSHPAKLHSIVRHIACASTVSETTSFSSIILRYESCEIGNAEAIEKNLRFRRLGDPG